MNANADNHAENAELSPLEKLNGLIFDLGDTLPEGVYLEMMNHTKKIFEEMQNKKTKIYTIPQIQQQRSRVLNSLTVEERIENMMIRDDKIFTLRRITQDIEQNNDEVENKYISLYEKNNTLIPAKQLRAGNIMRIYENGNDYKFLKLIKINAMSIKYDILYYDGNNIYIKKDNKLKFKDATFYENLENKKILFYNSSTFIMSRLWNKLSDNKEIINNNNLKISLI